MARIQRFGVAADGNLLEKFDSLILRQGYANRSEALRDLMRKHLIEEEWKAENREVVATVSLVYDHGKMELPRKLTSAQHHHYPAVISSLHVHLDSRNCLEVLILRGTSRKIRALAEKLLSTRGVKHGRFTMTTTGREIS